MWGETYPQRTSILQFSITVDHLVDHCDRALIGLQADWLGKRGHIYEDAIIVGWAWNR